MDQNEDPSLLLETYFSCGRNYNDSKCYEVARLIKISMKLIQDCIDFFSLPSFIHLKIHAIPSINQKQNQSWRGYLLLLSLVEVCMWSLFLWSSDTQSKRALIFPQLPLQENLSSSLNFKWQQMLPQLIRLQGIVAFLVLRKYSSSGHFVVHSGWLFKIS